MLYADTLNYLSHTQALDKRIATCEEARAILRDVGARDFTDLRAASIYADTSDSQARHSLLLGKVAEAEKLETEVYAIAEKVLAQRPGDLRSMANRALAADFLGRLAIRRHDYVAATDYAARSALAGENYVRFNPSDLNSWVYWVRGRDQIASILLEQGHIAAAHDAFRATVALDQDPRKPASLSPLLWNNWGGLALLESRMGDFPAAESTFNSTVAAVKTTASVEAVGSERRALFDLVVSSMQSRLNLAKGNNQGAFDLAMQTAGQCASSTCRRLNQAATSATPLPFATTCCATR